MLTEMQRLSKAVLKFAYVHNSCTQAHTDRLLLLSKIKSINGNEKTLLSRELLSPNRNAR